MQNAQARTFRSAELLKDAFKRKALRKSGYSQRALARDLGVSAAFVTNILTGRKFPPRLLVSRLLDILEMDSIEKQEYAKKLTLEKEKSGQLSALLGATFQSSRAVRGARVNIAAARGFLSRWYNFAVLEIFSTPTASRGIEGIAKALGLKKHEVSDAVDILLREELITKTETGYKKANDHLYIPTAKSRVEMRNLHAQMIDKAKAELLTKTSEYDFSRRLITGFTFTCRPEDVEEMKNRLHQFLSQLTAEFSAGDCSQVYQINAQLFPLTKGDSQ